MPKPVGPLDRLVTLPSELPALTLGWEALKWATKYLRQPNGPSAGQRFEFTPSQARFMLLWYGVDEAGEWLYRRGVRRLAKGSGKALALDTRLPTPTGWTTIGNVAVGDLVLDEHGQSTRVIAATDVMVDRACYRVDFRDGTSMVADAEHLWPMDEFVGGAKRRRVTVTTQHMAEAGVRFARPLTTGATKCSSVGVARWRTLPTPALDGPEVDLPLPAYLLGYWLGDGDSDGPRITIHRDDTPSFRAICDSLGVECGDARSKKGDTYRVRFGRGWAKAALRDAGLLGAKHVPPAVMRASYKQRLDVLRGLMDSDGTVGVDGRSIELCLCDQRLAEGCVELMRTLGLYPRMTTSAATLYGRVVGTRYRINVSACSDEPIFRLPRKADRLRARGAAIPYSQVRTVVAVTPVALVPVRCITVSGPSSLYLAGDGLIPTHNSPFAAVCSLIELCAPVRLYDFDPAAMGGCIGTPVSMPLVVIAATTQAQTENTMRMVRAFAPKGSRVVKDHGLDPGQEQYNKAEGGKLHILTGSSSSAEGGEFTFAVGDEPEHWTPARKGPEFAATVADNLAKSGSRMLETCNSWEPGAGSVAEQSFAQWVAQEEGRTRGTSRILYDARVAPPNAALTDDPKPGEIGLTEALEFVYDDCWWAVANLDSIRERVWDLQSTESASRRKYLNQPVADEAAWVTPQDWAKLADPTRVVADGEDVVLFFDGSKSRDATALIGCCLSDGYIFTIGVWEPNPKRTVVDVVNVGDVDSAVIGAFAKYTVLAFFADVQEWQGFVKVTWPERYAADLFLWSSPGSREPAAIAWDMRSRGYDFAEAAETCYEEIVQGRFHHDGDSRVARHVVNARRRGHKGRTTISKESPDSPRKIDAAVCVIGARMVRRLVMAKGGPPKPEVVTAVFF